MQETTLKYIFNNSFIKLYLITKQLYAWGETTKSHLTKLDKSSKKSMHIMLLQEKYDLVKPFYEYHT